MRRIILLLVIPLIFAFKAQFKYGCGENSCTYKFVMPENITRFVDPAVLVAQMNSLNYSIGVLEKLEATMVQLNTTDFNDAFTAQYNITVDAVTPVIDEINAQNSNFSSALTSSSSLHDQAALLTKKTDCFQAGLISAYCGNLTLNSSS